MTQLNMFEEQKHRRAELKIKEELTDFNRRELVEFYVDEYLVKRELAYYDSKWFYKEDKYRLLHYLMIHALGKKQSMAGYLLSNYMFNNKNTEKLRMMINELRNDSNVDVIIGSWAGGYFIAKEDEKYEAIKYIFGKSVNEMITVIRMFPRLFESYIMIAQKTHQHTDKAYDKQVYAQFENDTQEILSEIVVRYADTLKAESYKKMIDNK
jgi:hypothetical protein